ncbi:MAG: CoA-transferase [candidate division Zixibacteria bacterium]|nr:CoA-transferase [candidate division Zixibacteria bacterium]
MTSSPKSDYTMAELMVVAASREIKDNEIVFVGMRLPLLAFLLAKRLHAPSAVALFENGVIRESPANELLFTMGDPPNILGATMATSMITVMSLLQSGKVDVGFLGAGEVDKFGNLNSTLVIKQDGSKVRLPGSGGAADIASLAGRIVTLMDHSRKRLPERVSYLTSPGYGSGPNWREQVGLVRGGADCLITTKGILRFDSETKEAYLDTIHENIDLKEIISETGWALKTSDNLRKTSNPTDEELSVVRELDPNRFWTA